MADNERLNFIVDTGIGAMLTELAGGERKRGQYLTGLVRAVYENDRMVAAGADLESLRLQFTGMAARLIGLEGRLLTTERQLAALISERLPATGE